MIETEFIVEDGQVTKKVEDGVLIEGLPGIGLVAKVAVSYLIKKLQVRRICRILSPHFPSIGYISEGRLVFSFADIYFSEKPINLFLLYGNSQPSTSFGQYDFCEKVVRFANEHGCSMVLTLGGYGKESVSPRREIYCSSTNTDLLEEWSKKVGGLKYSGQIVGAAGLLAVLASEAGLKNFSMLVETAELTPDFLAARRALEATIRLLNLQIPLPSEQEIQSVYSASLIELEAF